MTCAAIPGGVVCYADEVDRKDIAGVDLRTRAGREREVLEQVKRFGGFSVFWGTENRNRAHAIDRLVEQGDIVADGKHIFPWCGYKVTYGK